MRRRVSGVLVALGLTLAAGCSGDDGGSSDRTTTIAPGGTAATGGQPLRVESMAAAVAAVEADLGGAQRYFEVNATPTLVNLFVAGEGDEGSTATAYVYDAVNATLAGEPTAPQPASGNTFAWSEVAFDPATVLGPAVAELPTALPRTFAVTAAGESAVQYVITLESTQGGVLDVLVGGDGTVIGAAPRSADGDVPSGTAADATATTAAG